MAAALDHIGHRPRFEKWADVDDEEQHEEQHANHIPSIHLSRRMARAGKEAKPCLFRAPRPDDDHI